MNPTTGAAATTLTSGDSIDGGAGVDTLNITATAASNNSLTGVTVKNVENINVKGSDFVGISVADAAILAAKTTATATKVATAADLTAAGTASSIATAAAATAAQLKLAADAVAAIAAQADIEAVADATVSPATTYTLAQYKAAAIAAQKDSAGVAITVESTILARADTLASAAASAKISADAGAAAATTAVATAATADATAAINLTAATTAAAGKTLIATLDAAQFVGSTAIAIDGSATTVTGLTTQTVELSGASMLNTLKYTAGATAANIALKAASGSVTLDDNSSATATTTVVTANVSGTVKAVAATGNVQATAGSITLVDALGASDTIKTLNLNLTSGATVVTSGMDKLVTFNAAGSTGAITAAISESTLTTVVGGSGNDVLDVTFETVAASSTMASASIVGGAGNDIITVSGTGTGSVTVDAGTGNDTVAIAGTLLSVNVFLNGGEGTDKLKFTAASTALNAGELALIASQTSGFERAEFVTTTSLDASKVSQFTILDAGATTATFTKLADAQTVNTAITAALTSASYVGKGSTAALAASLTDTSYGGNLAVNASGASKTVSINAASATVNVGNIVATNTGSAGDQSASSVTIAGDVKSLTVNLTAGANFVQAPSADVISTVTIAPTFAVTSSGLQLSENGNLTSVTLSGVGAVVIDNSAVVGTTTVAASKLVTVDASQLGGVQSALAGASAGLPLGGLTYTGNLTLAETISLGAGKDAITVKSTYDKMDTVNGFTLVANADGTLNANKSDILVVDTAVATDLFVKVTTGLTGTTLGAVLTQVAAASTATADDAAIFQFGGNTYVYVDGGNDLLDAGDQLIQLTGLVNLDLLKLNLEANNI
ncbi:MAG: hypothetical protein Q7U05_13645 [Polaromonas sp.]|nr:hypothetical protein [Polaromonas sp.]